MEIKITVMKIKIGETELELSADDARKLYDELHKIYGTHTISLGGLGQDGIFGPSFKTNSPNSYDVEINNG